MQQQSLTCDMREMKLLVQPVQWQQPGERAGNYMWSRCAGSSSGREKRKKREKKLREGERNSPWEREWGGETKENTRDFSLFYFKEKCSSLLILTQKYFFSDVPPVTYVFIQVLPNQQKARLLFLWPSLALVFSAASLPGFNHTSIV